MEEILEENGITTADSTLPESAETSPIEDGGEFASVENGISTEAELLSLAESFPEILSSENPRDIMNLDRYTELRRLGLTEREAYLATRSAAVREDNRAHLSPTVTREARGPHSAMPDGELRACRELFFGMSDAEIRRLYKRVAN